MRPPVAAGGLGLVPAGLEDVTDIARFRLEVAEDLTERFGRGPWSSAGTERGVRHAMKTSRLCVAKDAGVIVASLCLATRKPWAIDQRYFTPLNRPLYLTDMAVRPDRQRHGLGRRCMEDAARLCREWPADGIRLDAFDAPAGAGDFYRKCGLREVGRVAYRGTPLVYYELVLRPAVDGQMNS